MKKLSILFVSLILSVVIFSQERVNRENPIIIKKSEKLTKATGWQLNSSKTWIENQNVICDKSCPDYWISHESSNFTWIQSMLISYKNQKYYVLLRESLSGVYKYPALKEEWINENRTYYVIVLEKEYQKFLKQYSKKTEKPLMLSIISENNMNDRYNSLGGENAYTEENILIKIGNSIDKASSYSSSTNIGLAIQIYKNKVRFTVNGDYKKPSETLGKNYYEVPFLEFDKLIITE